MSNAKRTTKTCQSFVVTYDSPPVAANDNEPQRALIKFAEALSREVTRQAYLRSEKPKA